MSDATGLAEALLGLDGFRVLEVDETPGEVVIQIETIPRLVGCPGCGTVATAHDRMRVEVRDLPVFGRPARLVWRKRRWRCGEDQCVVATWTEQDEAFSSRCVPVASCRVGGVPAGGDERPAGLPAGKGAWGVLGHGDGRGE